jgi:phage-related tail fiber protein
MVDKTGQFGLSQATLEKLAVLLGERPRAPGKAALRREDEARILRAVADLVASSTPGAGSLQLFAGDVDKGWLAADGAAVSRTAYAALFKKIGTTYGAGDGSTTFNLPNETHPTLTWAIRI